MNRDKAPKFKSKLIEESDSDSDLSIVPVEAYLDALEMYIEAYKVMGNDVSKSMKAIYFSKAVLAYLDVENKDMVKSSKKLALTTLSEVVTTFESSEVHISKAAKLVIEALKTI